MKNKEIKLFLIKKECFVETNPIESQWICRNKKFPAPVEINSTKNSRKLPGLEFPTPAMLCRNKSH